MKPVTSYAKTLKVADLRNEISRLDQKIEDAINSWNFLEAEFLEGELYKVEQKLMDNYSYDDMDFFAEDYSA